MFRRLLITLVGSLIFFLPSNVFLTFPTGAEYVGGLRVDYLIPKLFLTDLVVMAIIVSFLIWKRHRVRPLCTQLCQTTHRWWLIILTSIIILFILRQFFAPIPLISSSTLTRLVFGSCLMLIIANVREHISRTVLIWTLSVTVLFQAGISWYQWVSQTSVAGFHFLGEPNLSHPLGLAKSVWFGQERIIPYGTTAHPNVLAGVIAVYTVAILMQLFTKKRTNPELALGIILGGISITTIGLLQSVSAMLAIAVGLAILASSKLLAKREATLLYVKAWQFWFVVVTTSVICAVFLFATSLVAVKNDSVFRRAILNSAAIELVMKQPLLGTGLSNFTNSLDHAVSREKVIVPFLQPAHNIFILSLAEVGLLGFCALVALAQLVRQTQIDDMKLGWFSRKIPLLYLVLLPIAVLDHYLLTIQSGLLLLAVTPLLLMKASPNE